MSTYQSLTIWDGGLSWEITVIYGSFETPTEAAQFANQIKMLAHDRDRNQLSLILKNGDLISLSQTNITVSKLKPESVGKLVVDANDYIPLDVRIKDFTLIEGLDSKSFGSLGYGVVDRSGNPVKINGDCSEAIDKFSERISQIETLPIYSRQQREKIYSDLKAYFRSN